MTQLYDVVKSDKGATTLSMQFGDKRLLMETGRLAKQAFSVVAQVEGTVVMANVVRSTTPRPGIDFFPLMVDYREKFYAAGRFPGGFFKREARPSTRETLRARLIDRPIRPLFPDSYANEIQVYLTVLSFDGTNAAEIAALNAASAALAMSDVPFNGPIGAVRVGLVGDELIANPTIEQMANSQLDLVVAGTKNAIMMVECGANELGEDVMLDALDFAHECVREYCEAQEAFVAKVGVPKITEWPCSPKDNELIEKVKASAKKSIANILKIAGKQERQDAYDAAVAAVTAELVDASAADANAQKGQVKGAFKEEFKEAMRAQILSKGVRPDGRKVDQIRPINSEVGVLPRTHGSAVFTRGETQALCVATLGTVDDEQMIDSLHGLSYQKFYLQYNFPSYSVGECRPPRGPGRREIGHGALAEKALLPVLPDAEDSPYTVRLVSEILESNGSSSMATVCGGSLALMDSGYKIKAPVAGIAMGLILEGKKFAVLSDISGTEDHLGDMDFKVAGTADGVTALQMDIKVEGVSLDIMRDALKQAHDGRIHILGEMAKCMEAPREEMSPYAPRIETIQIDSSRIRDLIGPGGKTINAIQEEEGVKINVEQDGTVQVASPDGASVKAALARIKLIFAEAEIGKVYKGKVTGITDFGCFVEIFPGRDGLVHISELALERVEKVEDVCKVGDELEVKCINVEANGKIRLSRAAMLSPDGEANSGRRGERGGDRGERRERSDRGDRGERSERSDRGDRDGDRGGRSNGFAGARRGGGDRRERRSRERRD